jgi:hypothetical protein
MTPSTNAESLAKPRSRFAVDEIYTMHRKGSPGAPPGLCGCSKDYTPRRQPSERLYDIARLESIDEAGMTGILLVPPGKEKVEYTAHGNRCSSTFVACGQGFREVASFSSIASEACELTAGASEAGSDLLRDEWMIKYSDSVCKLPLRSSSANTVLDWRFRTESRSMAFPLTRHGLYQPMTFSSGQARTRRHIERTNGTR